MTTQSFADGERVPPTPKKTIFILPALLPAFLALLLSGCMSAAHRSAMDDWERIRSSERLGAEGEDGGRALPALDDDSDLSDYLTYAALNNPGLEAAFQRWKAALERIPQVTALPDPKFTYAYFIRSVETRVGPQEQKFALAQTFPWLGKLSLQGDMALETAHAEKARYDAAKWKLFDRVEQAYFELYYLSRAIAVTEENLSLMIFFESVARVKFETAMASYGDVIKAQVELGKIEDQLNALRDSRRPLQARLNAAMGRTGDVPLPWPEELPDKQLNLSSEEIISLLAAHNPELKALDHRAAREAVAIRRAEKEFYPDFMLGGEWIETDDALMPGAEDSGKDPIVAVASINVPIWRHKYSAGVREAEARRQAALKEREAREFDLTAEAELALFQYRDAERRIDLYRDSLIPIAEQSLSVSQQSYAADEASFLDLIDAERVLLEFLLSNERARADCQMHLSTLKRLVGHQLELSPTPPTPPAPAAAEESGSESESSSERVEMAPASVSQAEEKD